MNFYQYPDRPAMISLLKRILGDKGVKIEKTTTYNPSLLFCVVNP